MNEPVVFADLCGVRGEHATWWSVVVRNGIRNGIELALSNAQHCGSRSIATDYQEAYDEKSIKFINVDYLTWVYKMDFVGAVTSSRPNVHGGALCPIYCHL